MAEPIDLVELVEQLRLDLAVLNAEAKDQRVQFLVDAIELELHVVAKREGGANGKVKFGVLEFGASGKGSSETGHTIRMKLTPKLKAAGAASAARLGEPSPQQTGSDLIIGSGDAPPPDDL